MNRIVVDDVIQRVNSVDGREMIEACPLHIFYQLTIQSTSVPLDENPFLLSTSTIAERWITENDDYSNKARNGLKRI